MNTRTVIQCVAATLALTLTSFLAQGAENESIQRCMDTFAAQNFADHKVTFVVKEEYSAPSPLVMHARVKTVDLVATEKASGQVLATATCDVKDGAIKYGKVFVLPPVAN